MDVSTANPVRDLNLRLVNRINNSISVILGLIENIVLLYLILTKTPGIMKIYRKILLQNCIVDLIYTISTGVAEPVGGLLVDILLVSGV